MAFITRSFVINGFLLGCLAFSSYTFSHSGGQDENGGHVNRKTGEYHCHKSDCITPHTIPASKQYLNIVSFNIQFLGHYKHRDVSALAAMLSPYDVIAIQELVAPPFSGTYPNNAPYRPDLESRLFFEAMQAHGFDYVLSKEDTGSGDRLHLNNTATEWWVTFYKPDTVESASDLPNEFLASDRSNHPDYERVPYAMSFRTLQGGNDFVFIPVHLKPGDSAADKKRRKTELHAISKWIDKKDSKEKDFFILGDMNFKNCEEISDILPSKLTALNIGPECLPTNTNINGPRPYDNVLYIPSAQSELYIDGQFRVINLIDAMEVSWYEDFTQPYPGRQPYNHNAFRSRYSDHHPIHFKIRIAKDDD